MPRARLSDHPLKASLLSLGSRMHSSLRRSLRLALAALLLFVAACGGPAAEDTAEASRQSDFHYQLSLGHYRAREVPHAIEELSEAIRLYPANPDAHFMLGFIFQGRQEYTRAIVEYRRALELRAGWFEVRNNLGSIYLATADWQQAIDIFGPLTDEPTYRTPGNAHNNLGWALYKMRRYDEAAEHFRSAVQFQPELCQGYNNQGLTYEALGQLADARKAYESCAARPGCKRYAEPRYRLANIMLTSGDVEGALAQFKSCAEAEVGTQFADSCREYLKAAGR